MRVGPCMMGLVPLWQENQKAHPPPISVLFPSLSLPCEDTVGRQAKRRPLTRYKPWWRPQTSSLQNHEKINFCCVSPQALTLWGYQPVLIRHRTLGILRLQRPFRLLIRGPANREIILNGPNGTTRFLTCGRQKWKEVRERSEDAIPLLLKMASRRDHERRGAGASRV